MKTCIAIALLLVACATDEDINEHDSELTSSSWLAASDLMSAKFDASQIGAASLASNSGQIQTLVSSTAGRATFTAIVACALPAASSITATDTGGTSYTFAGALNLAPGWATAAPSVSSRRWVTACVLARTNVYGLNVPVSLRHDTNAALLATNAEKAQFSTAEGGYFGDLFKSNPELYACASQIFAPSGDGQLEAIRSCARSSNGATTQCGFSYAWLCGARLQGHAAACTDTTAPYNLCRGLVTTYSEVVSVFSQP